MRSEGKALKNGEPAVDFSFTTMLQHTGQFSVKDFLSKNNVATLQHPPYYFDLAAADFYLFSQLKSALKGRRFCGATDITKNATKELKRLHKMAFPAPLQSLLEVYGCTRRLF
jgi:hypothetical protein